MEKINIDDYIYMGEGANGLSYSSRTNPDEMLKLCNPDFPRESVFREYENSCKLFSLGVPTPEPGVIVTDGERIGIRFKHIVGKRSFSRMFADEPERTDELARELARYYKRFHSISVPDGMFPDVKSHFLNMLRCDRSLTSSEHARMTDLILSLPDGNTLLHGDMHFGNVISTLPKGAPLTSAHDVYFIDLESVACGYPMFDFGMLMMICLLSDEDFRVHDFHIDGRQTREVWNSFVSEYFFADDNLAEKYFGPGQTPESIEKALAPYACVKSLLVGYNCKGIIPDCYLGYIRRLFRQGT